MRLVFAGSPAVALPSLERLLRSDHEVVAVVTRPDARAGRGRGTRPSAVAAYARERGIPVMSPVRASDPAFHAELTSLAPDCCPVVAYGALLPRAVLDVPAYGWVNLHFSLLPAWRGAAPVQYAVLHGDEVTGASTFLIEEALDCGPVFGMVTEAIGPRDTAGDLLERLSHSGADLLAATLDGIAAGTLRPVPQPAEGVSVAPRITVEQARLDWAAPAFAVDRKTRAMTPSPGAWTTFRGRRLGIGPLAAAPAVMADLDRADLAPGELRAERDQVLVGTGTGPVVLGEVTPEGRRPMAAAAWARGVRPGPGEALT